MSINERLTLMARAPTETDIVSLRSLWKEAFGDSDEFLDCFFATAYSRERCRCVIENGEAVAALYWFDCTCDGHRLAYIYAVATRMSHRGKGLCRKLMEATHRQLTERGYEGALLVPGESSLFDYYERFGYRTCSEVSEFHVSGAETADELSRVGKSEYAKLRRTFLPKGGVAQENENLDFLATYAEFYSGDGLLLAASRAGDRLRGIELLGDTDAASAVVLALGCSEGDFRTSPNSMPCAETRPFTMFLPLKEGAEPPSYFGIAFD